VPLFADDMKDYQSILTLHDLISLQGDFHSLHTWTNKWLLNLNITNVSL
jgi:hypothetical protein